MWLDLDYNMEQSWNSQPGFFQIVQPSKSIEAFRVEVTVDIEINYQF